MVVVSQTVFSVFEQDLTIGDCEEIRKIYSVLERFSDVRRPGAYLVDTFPALANFPPYDLISNWRKIGSEYHRKDYEIYKEFWDTMVKEIQEGKAHHSFGKEFVQSDFREMGVDDVQAVYICGAMIEAGSETTSAMLNNAIIGLLSNPSAIEAAQEELDRVVGGDRTPNFDDEPNLPYMRAIIKVSSHTLSANSAGNSEMETHQQIWK
jgi:cytochrome P450